VVRHKRAFTGGRLAPGLLADGIGALWGRACDEGIGNYLALVWQLGFVTGQCAVAEVTIFQCGAVIVILAGTGDGMACANAVGALIADGARIVIVTVRAVVLEQAAAQSVAGVVRTLVIIVTDNRVADTLSPFAMVSNGASVAVHTFSRVQDLVGAAILAVTGVDGARIIVIAEVDVVSAHLLRFIDIAVAVVINAVALLLSRYGGIARRQSLVAAHPLAEARASLIAERAGRGEAEVHRLAGAGAGSGIRDALIQGYAFDSLHFLARESPWAFALSLASPAAEVALLAVGNADIVGSPHGLAIAVEGTGFAEVCVFGDADEDDVRVAGPDLAAFPARWAFLLAGLGADCFAHVLDAPAGLAVAVFRALVEEAPFPGCTFEERGVGAVEGSRILLYNLGG